jgi:hypothetical protein
MKVLKIMIAALLVIAAQSAYATSGAVVVGDGYAPDGGGGVSVGFGGGYPYGSYCYNFPNSAGCGYYGFAGPVDTGFGWYGGSYNGYGRGYYRGGYRGGRGGRGGGYHGGGHRGGGRR